MKLSQLKDKKILILGFGREGQDTFRFLKKLFPAKTLAIADIKKADIKKKEGWKGYWGDDYLKALKNYDIIVKSPGIPFKILPKSTLGKITTQTEIFFDNCPGTIIGVTGTKGKSTTAFFISQVLKKAQLIGNIGKPALTSLLKAKKDDIFIYELSSFQLTNLKKSPHVAVLLNIYPEHLDYYRNFKEYAKAKANITRYQTKKDYLIYNSQDPRVKKIACQSKAKKIPIRGKFYELNKAAAAAVSEIFKAPLPKKFKFLPHRLEYVGRFRGIEFYNDSLSTIPETTLEALDYLGNKVQTLILGGFDRKLDFKKLARRIAKSQIQVLILFPTTGQRILKDLMELSSPLLSKGFERSLAAFMVRDMKEAVKLAYKHTQKGKICLLSPASPSFGIFKDYADRGNRFKKFVKMLK